MGWAFASPDGIARKPFRVSYDWLDWRYGLVLSGDMSDADTVRNYLHRSGGRAYIMIDPKDMAAVKDIMLRAEEFLRRPSLTASEKLVAGNIAKRARKWLEDV